MVMIAKGNPSLKAKRHRKQHSGEPRRQQAIVRGPSKHSTAIIFPKKCRTKCDPQHPADGRKACSGKRGTDELYCPKQFTSRRSERLMRPSAEFFGTF